MLLVALSAVVMCILQSAGENLMAAKFLPDSDPESNQLASLVKHLLSTNYPDCSLTLGMDHPDLSRDLERVLAWAEGKTDRPVMIALVDGSTSDPSFDPEDYPWVWKREHLLSFRTQPPEMRSGVWPGGRCAFNLILAKEGSGDRVPRLVMTSAALFMVRNLHDPFLLHLFSTQDATRFLLSDPVQGIKLKMLSLFNRTTGKKVLNNVCYCCHSSGEDVLNAPFEYPFLDQKEMKREVLFPEPPRNMNGKKMTMGSLVFHIDTDSAREKKRHDQDVLVEEQLALLTEDQLNVRITFVVPDLTVSDFHPNGSLSGALRGVVFGNLSMLVPIIYSDTWVKALAIPHPLFTAYGIFVTRTPRMDIKWYVIVKPFTLSVWMCLGVSLVITATFMHIVKTYRPCQLRWFYPTLQKISMWGEMMKILLRVLLEQSDCPLEANIHTNILIAFVFWFSMVITCAYKSKLVSFITFPPNEVLPRTTEELHQSVMKKGTTDIVLLIASLVFRFASDEMIVERELSDSAEIIPTMHDCLERTLQEDFACITSDFQYRQERDYFLDGTGQLTILTSEPMVLVYLGQGFSRDNVFYHSFNGLWMHFTQSGLYYAMESRINHHTFVRRFFKKRRENPEASFFDLTSLLTFEKLASVFGLWLVGISLSAIALTLEMYSKSKPPSKTNSSK